MADKLLRVRVYDDDLEMQIIHQAFVQTREQSRSKRGRARRGAESEFIRRLLVAGYRNLYGEFPRPGAFAPAVEALPGASEPPQAPYPTHKQRETAHNDIATKVASPSDQRFNDTAALPAGPEGQGRRGVDLSHLLTGKSKAS